MRVTRLFTALAAIALLGVACEDNPTAIPAGLEIYTATLNGANELPTPVTTTATGHATVTILGDSLVSWEVVIDSPIDSVTAGHIHRFNRDTGFGGVVQFLIPQGTPASGLDVSGPLAIGSGTPIDSVLDIIRDGRAYVNIHTRVNGAGEIRGNLIRQ